MYYHLRVKLIELLGKKGLRSDGMSVGNSGPRGVVFVRGLDGVLWEMLRIDTAKRGDGELLSPFVLTTQKFLVSPKEIEELAAPVVSDASLLKKIRVVDV